MFVVSQNLVRHSVRRSPLYDICIKLDLDILWYDMLFKVYFLQFYH